MDFGLFSIFVVRKRRSKFVMDRVGSWLGGRTHGLGACIQYERLSTPLSTGCHKTFMTAAPRVRKRRRPFPRRRLFIG